MQVDFVCGVGYYGFMRLDLALVQRNIYPTRARAAAAILAGLVTVNGMVAKKASQSVDDKDVLHMGSLPKRLSL